MKRFITRLKRLCRISKPPDTLLGVASSTTPAAKAIAAEPNRRPSSPPPSSSIATTALTARRNADNLLESLPAEIRRLLLSSLNLPELKRLVHASPVFHLQYRIDRRHLLCRSLDHSLGSVDALAHAVHVSRDLAETTTEDFLIQSWESSTSGQQRKPLVSTLSEDQAASMAGFHLQTVLPVVQEFTRRMLAKLAEGVVGCTDAATNYIHPTVPTLIEARRLVRAAYRFQLFCQLIRDDSPTGNWKGSEVRGRGDTALAFIERLQPWEAEELLTFYDFVKSIYAKIMNDIRWDVHPHNPKFDDQGRPPTPDGAFQLEILFDEYLEGTCLRGLSSLSQVLFHIKDREHLVTFMQSQMTTSYIPFSSDVGIFGEADQSMRWDNRPSVKDHMQHVRAPLPFSGDDEKLPPLAWTTMWGGTYSNLYGHYTGDFLREWGYVFWDAKTLEGAGGLALLKEQWGDNSYLDTDPRDQMFLY